MRRTSIMLPVLNTLMPPNRSARRPSTTFAKLLDRARREVGTDSYLPAGDAAGYRRLLEAYATAPGLTRLGWMMACSDIQSRIANQLRVQDLHERHEAIGREVIQAPIVVVGLPRTATTVTHKVIAQSEDHRAPALWELMYTALPLPKREEERRVKQINAAMRIMLGLAPAMRAIHPQRAELPDEDPWVLPHGGQHMARASMRDYENWCYERDYTTDYDYLKRVYQVLQHGREPKRWVIKSPTHLGNLDQIFRIFPDARVVWLHRDPATVMGSICSLLETSWRLHVRQPDLDEIGRMCLRQLPWMVERARAARLSLPREQIIDLSYHDVARQPDVKIPLLYERLGATWTDADAANLRATMARPSRRVHEYAISRYGLTTDEVEATFGDYSRSEIHMGLR
jgi:hypothetical protein